MNAPLIVVAGPTGSGKSGLAVDLARAFGGEVVNCDSVQVYRYLDIGTAKLCKAERQRVPHHLIDVVEPDKIFTAGEYLRLGRTVLDEIRGRQQIPIVTGGTGLYLRALLEGLFEGPKRSESLRARLNDLAERKGTGYLHRLLARVDADSARNISPNDQPKMIRALEVYFLTSMPISQHFSQGREALRGFEALQIGLNPPRQLLYEFIDRRAEEMFAAGLLAEVQSICSRFAPDLKPLQALGYAQAVRHLRGEIGLAEAIALTQRQTHHYAKRQLTWFRREKEMVWFEGFGSEASIRSAVKERVSKFLARLQTPP
ncbi:MAG: tRNA (adenosine(37)-N6)-dimethylallyltransferase MiaA [Acidobacteria bacterium]|nr:tRNA (adenosine(37)-N6)-dimethylallyltransferase MiaA [Acidobacteriota bacterium]MCI0627154.1 tRNA (adenosine(37)-N6)-dimethylallyltransferase MiaA [Acidobacteriota bacterium]MCI0721930.1 tRNA (adenosine(37)-N6)-dimethylallyltransferase MiaA [Acidobacteriota bacterium]